METPPKTAPKITPQIAIVGTEGSGKTVLASVLAKRMSSNTEGVFWHPRGWETAEYVEKVWNALNNGEWWKSTEAGRIFEMQWTLHLGQLEVPVKLIDSAGQDLRELFSKDNYKKKNLSGIQRELLDYIQTASIVIIVVNLIHFRGEPDGLKRKQNEFILKEIVDMFAADNKHQDIAVVFTAWDLYYTDITKNYGNFTNYLQKELPQLYNAIRLGHQSGDSIHWFPVAAVMDTEVKNNIRVPKPNFRSGGLDTLNNWLLHIIHREQNREQAEVQVKEYELKMKQLNHWLIPAVCGVMAGMVGLVAVGIGTAVGCLIVGLIIGKAGVVFFDKQNKTETKEINETNKTTETNKKQQKNEESRKQPEDAKNVKRPKYNNVSNNKIDDTYDNHVLGEDDFVVTNTDQPSGRKSKSVKF
jgi:GTPase SAR1 family protein